MAPLHGEAIIANRALNRSKKRFDIKQKTALCGAVFCDKQIFEPQFMRALPLTLLYLLSFSGQLTFNRFLISIIPSCPHLGRRWKELCRPSDGCRWRAGRGGG